MSPRAVVVRVLRVLHSVLGRWLAQADQRAERNSKRSWFGCDSDALRVALPRDPDEEDAEAWYRAHFKINGQPLP